MSHRSGPSRSPSPVGNPGDNAGKAVGQKPEAILYTLTVLVAHGLFQVLQTPEQVEAAMAELQERQRQLQDGQRTLAAPTKDIPTRAQKGKRKVGETNNMSLPNLRKVTPRRPYVNREVIHPQGLNSVFKRIGSKSSMDPTWEPSKTEDLCESELESFAHRERPFVQYFATKINRPENRQRLMGINQGVEKSDEDYLDRIDEIFLMGNPVGDELQLHAALSGLKMDSHMFRHMTKSYPISYADFSHRAGDLITRQKVLAQRLGEVKDEGKAKTSSSDKKHNNYRARKANNSSKVLGTFKRINEGIEVQIVNKLKRCCLLLRILILYNSLRLSPFVFQLLVSASPILVFDLQDVKPHEFVKYGLSCLERFSSLGDYCAKEICGKLRIAVAGGDGTVGWVLGCLVSFVGYIHTFSCKMDGCPSLKNILRIYAKKVNSSEWEQIIVPSSVRSIVALNLPSYGSGRNPWGNLKPDYLEKRGFVEAHADDGLLEVFGFKQGWHASMVMVELISAKHITQASAIRFELRGGEWTEGYMQMDGEPWK
ncbi:hypothetical protein ACS0TY_007750 [Phlomoides rotata]